MDAIVGYVLLAIFYGWITLSTILSVYWFWRPTHKPASMRLMMPVCFGTILGVNFLLVPGFEQALFFVPESWQTWTGTDDILGAEFTSTRSHLAYSLAFFSALGFFAMVSRRQPKEL